MALKPKFSTTVGSLIPKLVEDDSTVTIPMAHFIELIKAHEAIGKRKPLVIKDGIAFVEEDMNEVHQQCLQSALDRNKNLSAELDRLLQENFALRDRTLWQRIINK